LKTTPMFAAGLMDYQWSNSNLLVAV